MESYFPMETCQLQAKLPLKVADLESRFDIDATIRGGGTLAQSVALQHGIARALVAYSPDLRASLKPHKLLRRDDRMKERKKYGQKGARARFQYSKR
jgi:small subunit ribosomal protein S9